MTKLGSDFFHNILKAVAIKIICFHNNQHITNNTKILKIWGKNENKNQQK